MKIFNKTENGNSPSFIIVGLGNPGKEYVNTRHNVGFITIDKIAEKNGVEINKLKYNALINTCKINNTSVLLMKPQTFMNNSGQAVTQAMSFYKIPPENVVIIFDDISLDVGKMRIKRKGTHGGQNGVKSIITLSGSQNFPRIKIGIGAKPNPNWNLADWVLSKLTTDELALIDKMAENSCKAVECLVDGNTDEAMNLFNS